MIGKLIRENDLLYIRGDGRRGFVAVLNEDFAIELPLPLPVRGEGKFLLTNRADSILRAWKQGAELHLGDGEVSISLGRGKALAFLKAQAGDYPTFPTGRGPLVCPIALSRGLEVAARTALPLEKGETSFALLETAQGEGGSVLRVLGVNPYRVARYELPLSEAPLPIRGGFLSPKATLGLVPLLKRMRDALEVVPCEEGLFLRGGGVRILLRGKRNLPSDYWRSLYRILFREYRPVAELEVKPLQEALQRIKGFFKARQGWKREESIFLSLREGTLEVRGEGWQEAFPATHLSEGGLEGNFRLDHLLAVLPPSPGQVVLEVDEPPQGGTRGSWCIGRRRTSREKSRGKSRPLRRLKGGGLGKGGGPAGPPGSFRCSPGGEATG